MRRDERMRQFNHPEAFCLMSYVSDDGTTGELIWNSRDGVTPFVVSTKDGSKQMTHSDWHLDLYAPGFRPPPGFRYFVDMDEEMAREAAIRKVDQYWDHPDWPLSERHQTKEEAIEVFKQEYVGGVTVREAPARPATPSKFGQVTRRG